MTDIDDVRDYLSGYGIAVLEFSGKTPTAEAAAAAVGCSTAEIAKSILLLIGSSPVMVVTSGDMKVNSSLLKKASGLTGKVRMPDPEQVRDLSGYAPGGVSPFLLPDGLPVFLDESLKRFDTLYPAAGNDRSAAPIDFSMLMKLTGGAEADVCLPLNI